MTTPLRRTDYLFLAAYCVLLFGFAVWFDRTLTSHETVGCVNIREMRADGDYVIPHYGSRPWLERPPLPFWLTIPFVEALGDSAAAYRLAPLCVAVGCVLLVAWLASVWYGRGVGLLSGLILATIREFTHYATGPECDMFLCGVVTSAIALFVYLEFRRRPAEGEGGFFVGKRPVALLAFFILLGLANLAKGLFFGDLFILLPIAAYLMLGGDRWAHVKRYFWLPGWLAFAAAASAWAFSAYWRYPDIIDLWKHDYAGRYNQGYMLEPWWYYLGHLPLNLFPWTLVAFLGLAVTWRDAVGNGRTPERFLWCWALVPIAFFSIPQGKHHHYLLQATAPWAVLSALGTVRLWHWLPTVSWLDRPWPVLVTVALPGEVALALAGAPLGRLLPAALVLWPLVVLAYWWILSRPSLLVGSVALFALLIPLHWLGHAALPLTDDRFAADRAFVARVQEQVPPGAPLLVYDDCGPLGSSWFLYYLDGRSELLHHPSFLLRDGVADEVFVITRRYSAPRFGGFAQGTKLFESDRTQDEGRDEQLRFGLYRLRLHPGLARHRGPVYISPMQATGRALGPDLAGS
jgi:4-amino-4-deoxy-L-arabinose transferase-like glycosyltransferase